MSAKDSGPGANTVRNMKPLKLFLFGLISLIGVVGFGQKIFPATSMSGANYELQKLGSGDGTEFSAAFFKGGKTRVVVSVPGGSASKENYYFLAKRLQQINIASLLLDEPSENAILSAIDSLKQNGFEKICLVGGSIGAGTISTTIKYTLTEIQKGLINKVILIGPYSASALKTDKIKKLIIAAKMDSVSPLSGIQELYKDTSDPKNLRLYEGSWHAEQLFDSEHKDDITDTIIEFIRMK